MLLIFAKPKALNRRADERIIETSRRRVASPFETLQPDERQNYLALPDMLQSKSDRL